MGEAIPIIAIVSIFIVLPAIILHHITEWKKAKTLTGDDEQLLDHMYETARRLENRLEVVERIIRADNPDYRPSLHSNDIPDPEDMPSSRRARKRRK